MFWSFREELSVIDGVIYKSERLVIPASMQKGILKQLHKSHLGVEKTNWRARSAVYWPEMNKEIEKAVGQCIACKEIQNNQCKEEIIETEAPKYPFQMVAADLFYWNGQDFLLVVDYYSRYWEVMKLCEINSSSVIKKLTNMLSRVGIPEILQSDNGPQFSSQEFRKVAQSWNFQHITSSPYHPKSNGLAERYVQTIKNLLEQCKLSNSDMVNPRANLFLGS